MQKIIFRRKVLILSHRIDHLTILKGAVDNFIKKEVDAGILEKEEYVTSFYIGKLKKNERVLAEKADLIFGSVHMAEEGLDIPELNTIILATPKKDIEQAIGRILRKSVDNMAVVPLIIDISDQLSTFQGWGKKRKAYYKRNKYNTENYYVHNSYLISRKDHDDTIFTGDFSEFADNDPTVPNLSDIFNISIDDFKDEEPVKYTHEFTYKKDVKPNMDECLF